MKNIETSLKEYILDNYKSVREFSISSNIPYSTIDSVLKRGIDNTSVTIAMRICDGLGLSVDSLAEGRIERKTNPAPDPQTLTKAEQNLIADFRVLSEKGQAYIQETMRMAITTYKKDSSVSDMEISAELA